MKKHSTTVILGIAIFAFITFSCNQTAPAPLTLEDKAAIEDTIRQLGLVVENAANNLDLEASFDLFSDDPDFTFSEDGFIRPPKDSLYKIMKPAYANWSKIHMKYETMRVTVLDRNSGVFTGEGPWSATDLSGNEYGGHLVSLFVFVNRNGEWKMIHGHTSHTFI